MSKFYEKTIKSSIYDDKYLDDLAYVLGNKIRREIIRLLNHQSCTIQEISTVLNVPLSTISEHVKELNKVGIVSIDSRKSDRGRSKIVYRQYEKIEISLVDENFIEKNMNNTLIDIPIGSFVDYKIHKYCGMNSKDGYIGGRDNPDIFSCPSRIEATMIWFDYGYLTYKVPLFDIKKEGITSISIELELCSEAPGYNEEFPSDIFFNINGIDILTYTSPGDFGSKKGKYTPSWWSGGTQYGLLKKIEVRTTGSYLDGKKVSNTCLDDLKIDSSRFLEIIIGVKEDAKNRNGINLFGKNAGDYNQDINCIISYGKKCEKNI